MKKNHATSSAAELRSIIAPRSGAIRNRLRDFERIPPGEYFYELIYCVLTPQSSAVNADKVVRLLREQNFLHRDIDPEPFLNRKDCYIRFHKTKARSLVIVRAQFSDIARRLANGSSTTELREWLVKNVRGIGWKEASHFLRNIGHRDLAILDRHILRNLVRFRVMRRLPKTLTPKRYLSIEKKFRCFSRDIGYSMDELDLLFWSMETGEILK
jgi:N-glycosylase/DNA lyase